MVLVIIKVGIFVTSSEKHTLFVLFLDSQLSTINEVAVLQCTRSVLILFLAFYFVLLWSINPAICLRFLVPLWNSLRGPKLCRPCEMMPLVEWGLVFSLEFLE